MDIAALSIARNQASLTTQISTAVLSMSLDQIQQSGENLTKLMEQSVTPNLGQAIDIRL